MVNAKFLERLGLGAPDFRWICAITSWCVCEIAVPQPSRDQRRAASAESVSSASLASSDAVAAVSSRDAASVDVSAALYASAASTEASSDASQTVPLINAADAGEHDAPFGAGADALRASGARISAVLSPAERTHLGWRYKRLIDWSRVEYLRARGWQARLVTYVDRSVTKENTLLLAVSPRPQTTSTQQNV